MQVVVKHTSIMAFAAEPFVANVGSKSSNYCNIMAKTKGFLNNFVQHDTNYKKEVHKVLDQIQVL